MPESLQSLQSHCGDEVHEWQEKKKGEKLLMLGLGWSSNWQKNVYRNI